MYDIFYEIRIIFKPILDNKTQNVLRHFILSLYNIHFKY